MLTFFGRGNAFSEHNNSAYFMNGRELVLIDFPMSSFYKLRMMLGRDLINAERCTVLVTHTHGDHIGGIPTLIQYAYYVIHRDVDVIAPSNEVANDLRYLIGRLEGCDSEAYSITTAAEADRDWLRAVIPTTHAPELDGRCFGYLLDVDGDRVVYTGDTAVIAPFLQYLSAGSKLYADVSLRPTPVHLHLNELIKAVAGWNVEVYLMHLDDEAAVAEAIKGTDLKLAPLCE